MPIKLEKGPIVLIRWRDSATMTNPRTWEWLEDLVIEDCPIIESVGFLLGESETTVVLCQSFGHHKADQASGIGVIPKAAVVEVIPLLLPATDKDNASSTV